MTLEEHLAIIDSIPHPTNSDLNPVVNHLLKTQWPDLVEGFGPKEAARITRGALRIRHRYLVYGTSELLKQHHANTSMNGWLQLQMSQFLNS